MISDRARLMAME